MRKGLKFIIYFLLITVAADFLLSAILGKLDTWNRYGMSGGNINYYLDQSPPELLVMGSSRAHHYVIPDSLGTSAFNLSHNGMGIGFQTCLIDVLEQKAQLPSKYLLLEIAPEEFVADEQMLLYDVQFLNRYYRSNEYVRSQINRIGKYEFIKYFFRSFPLNGKLPSLINNSIKTLREGASLSHNGYSAALPTPNDSLRTMITSERKKKRDAKFDKNMVFNREKSHGVDFLNHTAATCKRNGIMLILFTTPYYAQSERFNFQNDLEAYFAENGLKYIDFSGAPLPELRDPWLWADNSHINHNGAQIFSQMLVKRFQQIK